QAGGEERRAQILRRSFAAALEGPDLARARGISRHPGAPAVSRPAKGRRIFQKARAAGSDSGERPQQSGDAAHRRRIPDHHLQRHRPHRGIEAQGRAEPHITVLVSAAVAREARHPAAARLFMNYLASDEGQKEILNIDKPPALPKFQPDYLRGVKLFPADWTLSDN